MRTRIDPNKPKIQSESFPPPINYPRRRSLSPYDPFCCLACSHLPQLAQLHIVQSAIKREKGEKGGEPNPEFRLFPLLDTPKIRIGPVQGICVRCYRRVDLDSPRSVQFIEDSGNPVIVWCEPCSNKLP